MVQLIPTPGPRSLVPPLLACLPTAFASPRPPPALLALLSPILRQRVDLLNSTSPTSSDSWLPLLCWDEAHGRHLAEIITDSDAFEPHPSSGEIEYGEVEPIMYRRLDEETLQARIGVREVGLLIIYIWCVAEKSGGSAWRISEVKRISDEEREVVPPWSPTMAEADDILHEAVKDEAIRKFESQSLSAGGTDRLPASKEDDEEDDGDYWAQYDKTPGPRTPGAAKAKSAMNNNWSRATSEDEYFAQYADVQPQMDNDDPSTDVGEIQDSTLDGNVMASSAEHGQMLAVGHSKTLPNATPPSIIHGANFPFSQKKEDLTSSSPSPMQRAKDSTTSQSMPDLAIKRHVCTSIKSMFRLCRSSGMELAEFNDIIQTELATLSMMEAGT